MWRRIHGGLVGARAMVAAGAMAAAVAMMEQLHIAIDGAALLLECICLLLLGCCCC